MRTGKWPQTRGSFKIKQEMTRQNKTQMTSPRCDTWKETLKHMTCIYTYLSCVPLPFCARLSCQFLSAFQCLYLVSVPSVWFLLSFFLPQFLSRVFWCLCSVIWICWFGLMDWINGFWLLSPPCLIVINRENPHFDDVDCAEILSHPSSSYILWGKQGKGAVICRNMCKHKRKYHRKIQLVNLTYEKSKQTDSLLKMKWNRNWTCRSN